MILIIENDNDNRIGTTLLKSKSYLLNILVNEDVFWVV